MNGPLWVFAYGSLMWRPGFDAAECRPALLRGLHRSFCVVSHVHRGTPEKPGLVAGLDHGGSCRGLALRVLEGEEAAVLDYLRAREQPTMVYRETTRRVVFVNSTSGPGGGPGGGPKEGPGGSEAIALCFVVDRSHHQYSGPLSLGEQAGLVHAGVGQSGRSIDYLEEMVSCLAELGIHDAGLERLVQNARRLR